MGNYQYMVSVIMITYNHEDYIRQALDSILMQHVNFNYEIIIGDDASTDKTQEIIREYQIKYPDKIKSILREENVGPTRNGYDVKMRSKGKYIAVLEGDDYWIDEFKLQKQVDFLEKNQEYIGCANKYLKVTEEGFPLKVRYVSDSNYNKKFTMADFLNGRANQLFQSASLAYRNIYIDSKIDLTITYRAHPMIGDGTILSILLNKGDFYIFSDQMSAYRVKRKPNADNAVSIMSRNPMGYTKSVLKYADILEDYFNNKYKFKFMRNIAIDFSLNNYNKLNKDEKSELKDIISNLIISEKVMCYFRFIKLKLRYYILYLPKKLLRWS